jgi:hypothetical protein
MPPCVVQPAAIAHQEPARLSDDEIAERRDPVLERHRSAHDTIAALRPEQQPRVAVLAAPDPR